MQIYIEIDQQSYSADLSNGQSLAITLTPNGKQPNHFGAPACTSQALQSDEFIGDTSRGGSCNVNQLTLVPHCNGTHTESVSHIVNQSVAVYQAVKQSIFGAVLISLKPQLATTVNENYSAKLEHNNLVITRAQLILALENYSEQQLVGLVIRTLPNYQTKKTAQYDNNNYPPFLTNDAMAYLVERKVQHLMVDFPSVDKMYDEGHLSNHRIFWNVAPAEIDLNENSTANKTITEMIYVDDAIEDGFYLCNLQLPQIETDAVPSRPVLFRLDETRN